MEKTPGDIKSVLIADDSRTSLMQLERLLEEILPGVKVYQASQGLDAYEDARDKTPDLVITTVRLSRMSGITLIKKIVSVREEPTPLKVILITLFNRKIFRENLGGSVSLGFISKPFVREELKKVMEELSQDVQPIL